MTTCISKTSVRISELNLQLIWNDDIAAFNLEAVQLHEVKSSSIGKGLVGKS